MCNAGVVTSHPRNRETIRNAQSHVAVIQPFFVAPIGETEFTERVRVKCREKYLISYYTSDNPHPHVKTSKNKSGMAVMMSRGSIYGGSCQKMIGFTASLKRGRF